MEIIAKRDNLKHRANIYIDKLFNIYISSKDLKQKEIEMNLLICELKQLINVDIEHFCDDMLEKVKNEKPR